ncbi:hypothetical protein [Paracoccus versutus]
MSDDLIDMLRQRSPIYGTRRVMDEAADEIAHLRAEVERLKADGQRIMTEAMKMLNEGATDYNRKTSAMIGRHVQQMEELRAALSDERRHADALAEAVEALDSHAVAIHDADGKCYSVRGRDYARLYDALAQHRARRQG